MAQCPLTFFCMHQNRSVVQSMILTMCSRMPISSDSANTDNSHRSSKIQCRTLYFLTIAKKHPGISSSIDRHLQALSASINIIGGEQTCDTLASVVSTSDATACKFFWFLCHKSRTAKDADTTSATAKKKAIAKDMSKRPSMRRKNCRG